MSPQPIGTIASLNASLTMFDAANATDWVPTKPAATRRTILQSIFFLNLNPIYLADRARATAAEYAVRSSPVRDVHENAE